MSTDVISVGEKLHVVSRRLFEEDVRRHFAGTITAVSGELVRVEGYTFVFHRGRNEFEKRVRMRTRVFSLADAGNIVNVLPATVNLEGLEYGVQGDRLVMADDAGFSLDINEFGAVA